MKLESVCAFRCSSNHVGKGVLLCSLSKYTSVTIFHIPIHIHCRISMFPPSLLACHGSELQQTFPHLKVLNLFEGFPENTAAECKNRYLDTRLNSAV